MFFPLRQLPLSLVALLVALQYTQILSQRPLKCGMMTGWEHFLRLVQYNMLQALVSLAHGFGSAKDVEMGQSADIVIFAQKVSSNRGKKEKIQTLRQQESVTHSMSV